MVIRRISRNTCVLLQNKDKKYEKPSEYEKFNLMSRAHMPQGRGRKKQKTFFSTDKIFGDLNFFEVSQFYFEKSIHEKF